MSLSQLASATRISVMSLEALERNDLARLPGGIFTRSFVRAYAQEVGLDPDRTIQEFIAELPPESAAATAHPAAMEDGEALESDRAAVTTAFKLILVSLPLAGFVIYYGIHPSSGPAGLRMEISTRADSFVSVTVDGNPVFAGVMHQGDTRQLSARAEIALSVGDAGAVTYTLNGREGRPLGAPGEVVSRRITLADSKEYVSP